MEHQERNKRKIKLRVKAISGKRKMTLEGKMQEKVVNIEIVIQTGKYE